MSAEQASKARIQGGRTLAHSSIGYFRRGIAPVITAVLGLWFALAGAAWAQTGANAPQPATSAPAAPTAGPTSTAPVPGPGLALYRKLRDVGLDPAAVYNVRDAAIQREDLHITLDDGTLAFVHSVDGRVTGAFFEGEGEVLLFPPDHAERGSLALFTGEAILEERFTTAYFRFNDRTAEELQPALRREEEAQAFVEKYDPAARTLAEADALRLMTTYLNQQTHRDDRLFRARLQGVKLGIFDVYFDTLFSEQITVLKLTYAGGTGYYDILCSFPMRSARSSRGIETNPTLAPPNPGSDKGGAPTGGERDETAALKITKYTIKARIEPPHVLGADVTLDIDVRHGEQRIEFFELSRYLKLTAAEADGKAIEFLQNEAIEGSALARRGNDVIAVLFPEALRSGQKLRMKFTYAGNVLSDAGGGLVYVGARGVWYPNRGLAMADYDLEFRYPQGWTLVATGKRVSQERAGTEQVSHYVSERPMPVAGFNLGRYSVASATAANNVLVEAYATAGMESTFPRQRPQVVVVPPQPREPRAMPPIILAPRSVPEPASYAEVVAQRSARAIDFFARTFGPYPYSSLTLSQMPGKNSQGWPGLVFLSSYAFLSPEELRTARVGPEATLAYSGFMQAHETAHQWWGDLVGWKTYRDQWLVEALASYSAILAYENDRAADSKQSLRNYRAQLLSKNAEGEEYARAGPVTLGLRLSSSHFPDGYDVVSYGRGAWLLHMLRAMMRDAAGGSDEPFLRALRKLRDRYQEREMTTSDFLRVMAEELPDSLRYEDSQSLEWFLESWVKGTAIPRLELKDVKVVRRGAGALVTGKILQTEAPDELVTSVPVYASVGGRQVLLGRVFADGKETGFRLSAPAGAKNLVLDPYDTVLKR
ncbi:MAG: M1 family metallopeptidase [Terriglobales bacterium]